MLSVIGWVVFAHGAMAQTDDAVQSPRLAKLSALHKMNVSADVYLSECDPERRFDPGPYFITNMEATRFFLMRELAAAREDHDENKALDDIAKRADQIAVEAARYFRTSGCLTQKAQAVKAHIEKLGAPRPGQFLEYLREIEKR
ncbi:MAG: hypothetical protein KDJ35_09230 [Alphaproteobacteria bacterium]|nr:hypothetical protein [Alphaproteobacteria bacterium]